MKCTSFITICWLLVSSPALGQQQLAGWVRDAETKSPLPFCNVAVKGTELGTITDEHGKFIITPSMPIANPVLILSFVGYKSDTVTYTSTRTFSLWADQQQLNEVYVVSGTLKEVSKMNSPIPVEIYSPALFQKNPSPSIFESLGMINGVQPQLNCNVCNTGDIHINGMEGPYTMLLIDGMPIVSSLATVYGLSGIPTSMVKRIEVVKGPASTLYGSEAVGGLINIITKDPASSPRLSVDLSTTSWLEHNADIATRFAFGNAKSLFGINYFNYQQKHDSNDDNFTDVTQQNRLSVFNKWDFERRSRKLASIALRYVYEDRWGGELQWNQQLRGSDQVYGESIFTNRFEFISNYELPGKPAINLDLSYNYHHQNSYYGTVHYQAEQQVIFAQLRWSKTTGRHALLSGIPFRFVYYDDNTIGTASLYANKPAITILPGLFLQDEWTLSKALTLLSGIRFDHHNAHGSIFSPRLSTKFSPDKFNTFRISAGNGFRVVNLFTEDHAALTGARNVIIEDELKPEQSWNVNLNYATIIDHASGFVNVDGTLFYTYFTNKILADYDVDPNAIVYANLNGSAISKGITLNTEFTFTNFVKLAAGVTYMNVYQKIEGDDGRVHKVPQYFAPTLSGTFSLSYTKVKNNLTFDITGRVTGPMHLPVLPDDVDHRPSLSPYYALINVQCRKSFSNGLELYGGLKNLLNFVPRDPLLNPQDPFSDNFDASYNYAPMQGIRAFVGMRKTIY